MIKKTLCIILLLAAVAAVVFAVSDMDNSRSLLPLSTPCTIEQSQTVVEQPDTLPQIETDSLVVE